MNKPFTLLSILAVTLFFCVWALWPQHQNTYDDKMLTLYCAAALRSPVSEIIANYEQETGRSIKVIYNGSGALLSQLKIGGGDLYLPANDSYINDAAQENLTAETIPVAELTAVIVVDKNNTSIQSLEDLIKPGVRISMADQSSAIGKHTRNILQQQNLLAPIDQNTTVTKPTVNNIIEDVALGSVDATLAWDAVAHHYPKLKTIPVSIFSQSSRMASIALLKSSPEPAAALHFARYLTSKDKGLPLFKKHHFKVNEK